MVSRDVEPLSIVAGVPARVVGHRSPNALGYALDTAPVPLFE
jgi:acetyltransferase-like isoleucine patch superfamily enzyme